MRRCASAVECSRSIASVAKLTAVSKPKQLVVPTMSLSIVFGHADERDALLVELVRDGQRAVAADADQRVELHLAEHLDDAIAVVEGALRGDDRLGERVAAVDGAEHRAAEAEDAGDVARRQDARLLGIDQAVEAVLEADDLNAGVAGALTTARMTAFRPGASPPPVRTPIFFILGISVGRRFAACWTGQNRV